MIVFQMAVPVTAVAAVAIVSIVVNEPATVVANVAPVLGVGNISNATCSEVAPVLATAIGIAGGVQIAAALAVPIPQFAEGTDNAPEGYAIVGEKGTELVTEPSGKQWLTPAKDTLTYLKKGSKVTTNEDLMDMVKNQAFATLATMNKPITTDLYGKQLIEQFEALTSKVDKLSDVMSNKNMSTQIVGNFDHYMHVKNRVK